MCHVVAAVILLLPLCIVQSVACSQLCRFSAVWKLRVLFPLQEHELLAANEDLRKKVCRIFV